MKNITLIWLFLSLMAGNELFAQNLTDYRWKNRILILSDTDKNMKNALSAVELINSQVKQWKERDVIILFSYNGRLKTTEGNILDYDLELPINFKGYLLIGKDGGIKMKGNFPLIPEHVFNRIDSMPMRRAEMNGNNPQ